MPDTETLSHTRWDCKYHVVFIPKCRRKTLYGTLRKHLGEVFRKLAAQKESRIEEARRGLLEEGWVDVYPNLNKSAAQFSSGSKGTHPFIVMLYDDTIFSMSTLAHELGHAYHNLDQTGLTPLQRQNPTILFCSMHIQGRW